MIESALPASSSNSRRASTCRQPCQKGMAKYMSFKALLAVAATAIGLTALASPAKAAPFNFSYDNGLSGDNKIVVTGTLEGTLQDANIVNVTGFSNLLYNGTALNNTGRWDPGYVDSAIEVFVGSGPLPAQVSFDGTVMDLVLMDNFGTDFILFGELGQLVDPVIEGILFSSSLSAVPGAVPDLAGNVEVFNPGGWSLTAVPEPGTGASVMGLGALALLRRRRNRKM